MSKEKIINLDEFKDTLVQDLCDYYGVSNEDAIKLGTRGKGRKPNLPASKTCVPISNMTYEDIWGLKSRDTIDGVFEFYKDQGSWSTFRQVVRHLDLIPYHIELFNKFQLHEGMHICEYGCGVAPFCRTLFGLLTPSASMNISISDVDGCEHFTFADWRLRKVIEDKSLNVDLRFVPVKADQLPVYHQKLDLVLVFEVLEHVPSPVACIKNIHQQMNVGGMLVENFIKHEGPGPDGPDLMSARLERQQYYDFLQQNFVLLSGGSPKEHPDVTRIWRVR